MKLGTFNGFLIRKGTYGLTEGNLVRLWISVGWGRGSAQVPERLLNSMKKAGTVFTAWDGDKLIGLCSAMDDGLNAWISYMVVDSAYQNTGLGGYLLDNMLTRYTGYCIYVQTANATKFYKKHGFKGTMTSLKLDDVDYTKG